VLSGAIALACARRMIAALDQGQDRAHASLTREFGPAASGSTLGHLLQNLLKHLGRIVLTTLATLTTLTTARSSDSDLQHFDGH
jgi:hypothetical protein